MCLYLMWVASNDVEVQKRGMVFIVWPSASMLSKKPPPNEHEVGGNVSDAAPVRVCSIHFVLPSEDDVDNDEMTAEAAEEEQNSSHNNNGGETENDDPNNNYDDRTALVTRRKGRRSIPRPLFRLVRGVLLLLFGEQSRARIRFHSGTVTECQYALLGYGIPVDLIPITETGTIKTKNQLTWIKARKAIEAYEDEQELMAKKRMMAMMTRMMMLAENGQWPENTSMFLNATEGTTTKSTAAGGRPIECPARNDVCFRFGIAYLFHTGNSHFRDIMEANMKQHTAAQSAVDKVQVTWKVVEELERTPGGCRFLEYDRRGWWVEIRDRTVKRNKVAHAMKEHKKRMDARAKVQTQDSCTSSFLSSATSSSSGSLETWRKRKRGAPSECVCFG